MLVVQKPPECVSAQSGELNVYITFHMDNYMGLPCV
jgi:hypothetical protein